MHEGDIEVLPLDDANRTLLHHAHPADWVNPEPAPRYNLVVLGGGTAGLVRAARPNIPGLTEAGYLTNENVFNLTALPRRLAVIGAGPIGCELAQAFARFGSEVHLLGKQRSLLPREDPDAAAVVERSLTRDG